MKIYFFPCLLSLENMQQGRGSVLALVLLKTPSMLVFRRYNRCGPKLVMYASKS